MNKKGFTLMEVLAIIIILAIISTITVPVLKGAIEKSRRKAVINSAYGIIDTADLYFAANGASNFTCNSITCENKNKQSLYLKANIPTSGNIIASSKSMLDRVVLGNYCLLGDKYNLDIGPDCDKLDVTKPILEITNIKSTSKSIFFEIKAEDLDTSIKDIEYEINGVKSKETYNTTTVDFIKKFDDLVANKEYNIKITVTNGKGLEESYSFNYSTLSLGSLTVKLNNTPSNPAKGYLKKQVAYLDYSSDDAEGYYIKTEVSALSSTNTKKECAGDIVPTTCTDSKVTSLEPNKWYYFEASPRITFDEQKDEVSTLYARVTNGVSITSNSSAIISKIDSKEPLLALGDVLVTTKSVEIPITTSDEHSGIDNVTCKYSTTSGTYTTNASITTTSECIINNINHNTTYYFQVCANDLVGNSKCLTGSSKTSELSVALLSTSIPSTPVNGFVKKQVWNLTTSGNVTGYYIKSTSAATSSVNLISSCGTNTIPDSCTTISSTKNIVPNTWYYTTSNPSITYDKDDNNNQTLYARVTDGFNKTSNASATVLKIKTKLVANEVSYSSSGWNVENVQQALDDLRANIK